MSQARKLQPRQEREKILRRARQLEVTVHINERLSSPSSKLRSRPVVSGGIMEYSDGMSGEDVERFRKHADGCHQRAQRAINPLDKEAWLLLADDWIKLAQAAEERQGRVTEHRAACATTILQ